MAGLTFLNNCVGWPRRDVFAEGGLSDMIDRSLEVTRKTFMKHVDKSSLRMIEVDLGYTTNPREGMTMAGDCYVAYYRSKLHGKTVYFLNHSAIEYVFA